MNKDKIIIVVSIVTTFVWTSLILWIRGYGIGGILSLSFVISVSTFISGTIVWLIKNYLWRWPYIKYLFGNYPNLNGEWDVTRQGHDGSNPANRIATIKQKWDDVTLHYDGGRSNLQSTLSRLEKEGNVFKLKDMATGAFRPGTVTPPEGMIYASLIVQCNHDASELTGICWGGPKQGLMAFKRKK